MRMLRAHVLSFLHFYPKICFFLFNLDVRVLSAGCQQRLDNRDYASHNDLTGSQSGFFNFFSTFANKFQFKCQTFG